MSMEAVSAALKTKFSNPSARLVLISLADHHNRSTGLCFPKVGTIVEDACVSRATVFRSLEWLEQNAFIERIPVYDDGGRQTSSKYRLLFLDGERASIGSQNEMGGSHNEMGEGLTDATGEGRTGETPLKTTGRKNRKKEQNPPNPPQAGGRLNSISQKGEERPAPQRSKRVSREDREAARAAKHAEEWEVSRIAMTAAVAARKARIAQEAEERANGRR